MFEVTVEPLPFYKYRVDFDYPLICQAFKDWFSYEYTESVFDRSSGKRVFEKGVATYWIEGDETSVVIRRGHLAWVDWWLTTGAGSRMSLKWDRAFYSTAERPFLEYPAGDVRRPVVSNTWLTRFCSHPRGPFYVEAQMLGYTVLVKQPHSSIDFGTGLGKSEILLALRSAMMGHGDAPPASTGRGLLLIPGESVKRELQLRSLRWEEQPLAVADWSPENRLNLINVVGFMNSYEKDREDVKAWLSEVDWVLVDEAHKLSSKSAIQFFDTMLPNLQRSMAVSGSLDKNEGQILSPTKIPVRHMGHDGGVVTGLSGATAANRKVEVITDLTVYTATITDPVKYELCMKPETDGKAEVPWLFKLDCLIDSKKFPHFIKHVYETDLVPAVGKGAKLYIPFASTESAGNLEIRLLGLGLRTLYWSSGVVRLNGAVVGNSLDEVKRLAAENAFDIILTSKVSYEGIDLPGIDGVMPVLGSNWAMIAQPIGRAARGQRLRIYMIKDLGNDYVANGTVRRRDKVMEEYKIESFITKDWEYKG